MDKQNISTLVDDIEKLFEGKDLSQRIEHLTNRLGHDVVTQFKKHSVGAKFSLRMSNIGKPLRQLWYDSQNLPQPPIHPSNRMRFLYGSLLETLLIHLIKESGHKVSREQEEVVLDGVVGHIDLVVDDTTVVDIKSASPKSFQKFKDGSLIDDDSWGYCQQLAGYSTALGGMDGAFLAINKVSGELHLLRFSAAELAMLNAKETIRKAREVLQQPDPPERCYQPKPLKTKNKKGESKETGNFVLPFGCVFCPHKVVCHADANEGQGLKAYQYSWGVQYLTTTKKKPKVPEVAI